MTNNLIPYEKRELAIAMIRAGKTYREVAVALNMGTGSVHRIIKAIKIDPTELAMEIKREFAAKSLILADYIMASIDDVDIMNASLKDNAIAAAIFADKGFQLWPKEEEEKGAEWNGAEQGKGQIPEEDQEVEPGERNT